MRSVLFSVAITAMFLFGALGFALAGGGQTKIELCHFPPGNLNNAHTIKVGEPAMAAHMAHADFLGGDCSAGGYGYR